MLNGLSPLVFEEELLKTSEVWARDCLFERGQHYLVEAESGAGKSSLCAFLYGYRGDYRGRILLGEREARSLAPEDWAALRRTELALLFQDLRLFPQLTVLENLQLQNALGARYPEARLRALLDRLDIGAKASSPAGRLSVGQQQRVALLRTLCRPFSFLLLDEPISHLDDERAAAVAGLCLERAREEGASIIVTSVGRHLPLVYHHTLRL